MHADNDTAPIFCVFWVLKLGVHAPAMGTLARVISNERATLASVVVIFVMVLVPPRPPTHMLERARQPKASATSPMRCGGRW